MDHPQHNKEATCYLEGFLPAKASCFEGIPKNFSLSFLLQTFVGSLEHFRWKEILLALKSALWEHQKRN